MLGYAYVVIPCMGFVVYDCCTKATCRVDARSSNGNGSKVHQENGETNRKWCQDLIIIFIINSQYIYL